jgi:hypothetical protein
MKLANNSSQSADHENGSHGHRLLLDAQCCAPETKSLQYLSSRSPACPGRLGWAGEISLPTALTEARQAVELRTSLHSPPVSFSGASRTVCMYHAALHASYARQQVVRVLSKPHAYR